MAHNFFTFLFLGYPVTVSSYTKIVDGRATFGAVTQGMQVTYYNGRILRYGENPFGVPNAGTYTLPGSVQTVRNAAGYDQTMSTYTRIVNGVATYGTVTIGAMQTYYIPNNNANSNTFLDSGMKSITYEHTNDSDIHSSGVFWLINNNHCSLDHWLFLETIIQGLGKNIARELFVLNGCWFLVVAFLSLNFLRCQTLEMILAVGTDGVEPTNLSDFLGSLSLSRQCSVKVMSNWTSDSNPPFSRSNFQYQVQTSIWIWIHSVTQKCDQGLIYRSHWRVLRLNLDKFTFEFVFHFFTPKL